VKVSFLPMAKESFFGRQENPGHTSKKAAAVTAATLFQIESYENNFQELVQDSLAESKTAENPV
jgi:hypothetical protein